MNETKNIQVALAELEANLAADEAKKLNNISPREGVSNTLASIYKFLRKLGLSVSAEAQIYQLVDALNSLDVGEVRPLLSPVIVKGNRPTTEGDLMPKAVAAAALHLKFLELKTQGEPKALDAAATWVARKIRNWEVLKDTGSADNHPNRDMGRIKKWRTDFIADPSPQSGEYFKFLISKEKNFTADQILKDEPEQWGFATKKFQ